MAAKKIRVAQVIGKVSEGGVEKMIMNLYEHIDHSKVVFDFFVENTSIIINKERIEELGGKVVIIQPYTKLSKFKNCLKQAFTNGDYDIVHVNMNALSFIALKVAKKCNIPVRISHSHSTSNKKEHLRHLIKNLLRPFSKKYATHYFACSELAGKWLFGEKLVEEGKIEYIDNAIDLEKYKFNAKKRSNLRKELNIPEQDKVIGHVGRFCSQKNQIFLVKAFELLQKEKNNKHLLLIGSGEQMDDVKKYVTDNNIKNVIFTGPVSNVFDYYNVMDVFALPSLYEGLPVVGVEAQANHLKCFFSANITTEAKLLDDTEYLSLDSGIENWKNKIEEYLDNDIIRLNGEIDKIYDINNISNKLLSLYEQYIKEAN